MVAIVWASKVVDGQAGQSRVAYRLTSNRSASSRSPGSRLPAGNAPSLIRFLI